MSLQVFIGGLHNILVNDPGEQVFWSELSCCWEDRHALRRSQVGVGVVDLANDVQL